DRDVDRRAQLPQRPAELVVDEAVERCPDDPAGGVEDEEAAPLHVVRAGEECRPRAEDRDESPPEDDLAAVAPEEPDPDLEPPLVQADLVTVPHQQPGAAVAADGEADVVPEDRPRDRHRDDPPDLELVGRAGVERRPDERRLALLWNDDATYHHEQEEQEVAVRR